MVVVVVIFIFIFIFWGYPESLPPPLSRRGYELGGCGGVFSPARICNPYYISPSLSLRPIFFYSLFLFKVFFFFTGVYQTQNDLALFPYIYRFRSMTPTHHIIPSGITSPMSPAIFLVFFFFIIILIFWLLIQFHVCVANFIAIAKTKFVSFSDYV